MNQEADIRLNVRITKEMREALKDRAELERKAVADLVRELIDEYLAKEPSRPIDIYRRLEALEKRVGELAA